jgi:hypothetical protein
MAEIRIKKRRSPIWPWLVGILIVLGALWFMLEFFLTEHGIRFETSIDERYRIEERYREGYENYPTYTKRIDDFIALINDKSFIEEDVDEERAREGMQLLSEALDEVIEEQDIKNQEIIADKHVLSEQVNGNVNHHNEDLTPDSDINRDINRSFYTAANLFAGIQQEQYPELGGVVAEVQESAMAIEPSEEIREQGEKVKDFLIKSGHALQSIRDQIHEEEHTHGEVRQTIPDEVKLINQIK